MRSKGLASYLGPAPNRLKLLLTSFYRWTDMGSMFPEVYQLISVKLQEIE